MALAFRNLNVTPDAPVEQWGFEGLLAAVERGDIRHWRWIAAALRKEPRGKVAAELSEVISVVENPAMVMLFERIVAAAAEESESAERAAVVHRLRTTLAQSGLSRTDFAHRLGTSPSRLSTYLNGKVVPSAVILHRAECLAGEGSA